MRLDRNVPLKDESDRKPRETVPMRSENAPEQSEPDYEPAHETGAVYCRECGAEIRPNCVICPCCGCRTGKPEEPRPDASLVFVRLAAGVVLLLISLFLWYGCEVTLKFV